MISVSCTTNSHYNIGESKINEDNLKEENPLKYYLEHIGNQEIMSELRWKNPEVYEKVRRISYVLSFMNTEPIYSCPECRSSLESDDAEVFCSRCGLVVTASIQYVAGEKIFLPYGVK